MGVAMRSVCLRETLSLWGQLCLVRWIVVGQVEQSAPWAKSCYLLGLSVHLLANACYSKLPRVAVDKRDCHDAGKGLTWQQGAKEEEENTGKAVCMPECPES